MKKRKRIRSLSRAIALAGAALAVLASLALPSGAAALTLPAGFNDETVFSGLNQPTIVKFAPDGKVFVAEKGGKILVFDSLADKTPKLFANLAKPVYDYSDHGLLGLAIDPGFDGSHPYVYALYTFNHKLADKGTQGPPAVTEPQSVTPAWPQYKGEGPGKYEEDKCPEAEEVKEKLENKEEAKEEKGCEVSGLLVRLTAEGDHASPSAAEPEEEVLLEGWCQQATTHSIGGVGFGPEGNLFVSGGEGAMYREPDYGQFGNVCEDPPEPLNSNPTRVTAEGGSLRSQSVLRKHGEPNRPTLLSGTVLRIDPVTGEGVSGNPFYANSEPNAKRIFAFGFRNPWRFAFNPRTSNLFVDNVGNGAYEEVDRIPVAATPEADAFNSGWPCYEGGTNGASARNYEYTGVETEEAFWMDTCKGLYKEEKEGDPQTVAPFFAYHHDGPVAPGDPCYHGKNLATDIGGNAFYEAGEYPAEYRNALFFSDPIRGCIYVMKAGITGEPDPATVTPFLSGGSPFPGVDIEQGPEGNIFYISMFGAEGGTVHRISYERTVPVEPTPPPTPPATTYQRPKIHKRPAKKTTKRFAKFAFGGAAALSFRCRIDGKRFKACGSPRIYKHLVVRKHAFRVAGFLDGKQVTKTRVFRWRIVPHRGTRGHHTRHR